MTNRQILVPKENLREHLLKDRAETELRRIIYHIAGSCKYIAAMIGEHNRKLAGSQNKSGEQQLELDVVANQIIRERLKNDTSFGIKEFSSEEEDRIVQLRTRGGHYSVAADPIDGSSLVDVNLTIGAIFAIHEGDILQSRPGRGRIVAAMYVMFGPLTTLVYSAGEGVHEFVLDPTGHYVVTTEDIRLEDRGSIYSPGGLKWQWLENHAKFIERLESERYKLRYSGGLVSDLNQIMLKGGGIFTYPALQEAPDGKLRLLFELQAMAYIVEKAGGRATNGRENILDIVPDQLNQRCPIYMGSRYEVDLADEYMAEK